MRAYHVSRSAELFPQHCQVLFLMRNKHLQEVIDKPVTTLHKLPLEKCSRVISIIQNKLSTHTTIDHTRTLAHPMHDWLLPPAIIQWAPYIPPPEQRVEQRVNTSDKQKGGAFHQTTGTHKNYQCPPLSWPLLIPLKSAL
jgi:hypothetical protein